MYIVTVVPISKGITKDILTYFSKSEVKIGSIVKIPLRKKIVWGLVTEIKNAIELKTEIKSLPFTIKKVEEMESISFLDSNFISSVSKISDYYASSFGSILYSLLPKTILEENSKLFFEPKEKPDTTFHEIQLLQADNEERFATYKSLVREEFAKNHSVFFCVPTIEDLVNSKLLLEKGIEKYTKVFHSGLSKKEIVSLWKETLEEKHPVLIIGTGSFLSVPRYDIGTIIIEKESSRGYKTQSRPFLDYKTVAEILSKEMRVRLVLGDFLLRVETLWEEKRGKYSPLSPLKFRLLGTASPKVIDMKNPEDLEKKEFKILSDETIKLLKHSTENNEHIFLFCSRKGMYPQTVCSDCGTIVVCGNCKMPLVLYSKNSSRSRNFYVCNHCGEKYDSQMRCSNCNGWRLNPLGIGIEKVEEEIKNILPNVNIYIFDKDHIKTHKKAEKIRDDFYSKPGSIILGTEMALSYLNTPIENSIVISIDSYFSVPDFQINEKVFHILLEMRNLSTKEFLVQTRQQNKIFDYAVKGNLIEFFRDEIEERKSLGYPPFNTYIKLSLSGDKNAVRKEMEQTKEFLKPFELQIFDAFGKPIKNKHTVNGLLYFEKNSWPNKDVLSKLRSLSPKYSIRIDPNSLL